MKKSGAMMRFLRGLPVLRHLLEVKAAIASLSFDVAWLRRSLEAELAHRGRAEAALAGGARSLHRSELSVYSQNGEDGVLVEIFRRIGAPTRTFVEFGVGDGWENNTLFLYTQGWRGCWIDGDDSFLRTIASWPQGAAVDLRHRVAHVSAENAARLLEELEVPREFDLLSLDLDQNTYHVWAALAGYRPRAIVIEYNAICPPSVDWKVGYAAGRWWDGSDNYGASLKALELLGRQLGYRLVHCELTGVNAFFVRDDLAGDHFEEPATAEQHYESTHRRPEFKIFPRPRALLDRTPSPPV